jgi:hypothetical protein
MAHFAELNETNVVIRVIVIDNDILLEDGLESESKGIDFCKSLFGGNWLQTSYNENIRKNYAGIGFTYDPIRDAFIPPKPEEGEYIFNEDTCKWEEIENSVE